MAIRASPPPPDDRAVWVMGMSDEGMGQGATVVVDATDGRVLLVESYIR